MAKCKPNKAAKPTTKKARRKGTPPVHPLMLNKQSWDRDKVMAIICERIATSSHGLATILRDGHEGLTLPRYSAIAEWLAEDAALAERYARAKADQADYMADEMLEIADDRSGDTGIDPETGREVVNRDAIQRARLRVDTRKWLASKLKAKKYGDKTQVEHAGDGGGPIRGTWTIEVVRGKE